MHFSPNHNWTRSVEFFLGRYRNVWLKPIIRICWIQRMFTCFPNDLDWIRSNGSKCEWNSSTTVNGTRKRYSEIENPSLSSNEKQKIYFFSKNRRNSWKFCGKMLTNYKPNRNIVRKSYAITDFHEFLISNDWSHF